MILKALLPCLLDFSVLFEMPKAILIPDFSYINDFCSVSGSLLNLLFVHKADIFNLETFALWISELNSLMIFSFFSPDLSLWNHFY